MHISFQKNTYELPDPLGLPDEAILDVQKVYAFPQPATAKENRFQFSQRHAKVFFFLFREGISLTVRKIMSSLLQRRVIAEKRVVFAFGKLRGGDSHAIAIGPQQCFSASVQTFPIQWTVSVPRDFDTAACRDMLAGYFDAHPGLYDEIFHYSPFSGLSVRFALNDVIHHQTRFGEKYHERKDAGEFLSPASSPAKDGVPVRERRLKGGSGNEIFLIGCGAYAFAYILPFLRGVRHHTVVDLNAILAAVAAERYGFVYADTSYERALKQLSKFDSPVLVVATYHSTHFEIVEMALGVNHNTMIFLEKPPVTSLEDLERLLSLRKSGAFIEIGYNRRYSPMVRKARELIARQLGPVVMTCIVKELALPAAHWYYWPTQGTRITGNLCHWLDLGVFIIGRTPVEAMIVASPDHPPGDEVTIVVHYDDGSRLNIVATDQGNPLRGVQEMIDIRRGDLTITIDDFLCLRVQNNGRHKVYRRLKRDKGHKAMYQEFVKNLADEGRPTYPDADLNATSRLYLGLADAARRRERTLCPSYLDESIGRM
jgi:predicted dehydrogenase